MVLRPPIETWTRPQLEDHYHNVFDQLQASHKKNRELEKQLLQFNTRLRRNMLERKVREDTVVGREKFDEVVKENKLLLMKLKAAKHQLLVYTAPSARAATASALTGRSTFRPQPTWRRQPVTAVNEETQKDEKKSETMLQLTTDEKLMIVRLNRTLKSRNQQISDLQYTVDQLNEQLNELQDDRQKASSSRAPSTPSSLSDDNQSILSEFSNASFGSELKAKPKPKKAKKERRIEVIKSETTTRKGSAEKQLESRLKVAEQDLRVLQSENQVLKDANERLVQQSLSRDFDIGAKDQVEAKKQIVVLEEKVKETERRLQEAERRRKEEHRNFEEWKRQRARQDRHAAATPLPITPQPPQPVTPKDEDEEPELKKRSSKNKKNDDDLLTRLYNDVAGILSAHDMTTDDLVSETSQNVAKWQKLYAELYEELEKVRSLLLIQHNITQKQASEIRLLNEEVLRVKTLSEQKMLETREKLEEKQKKIFQLEEQIRTIAYSGQKPLPLRVDDVIPNDLSTQLSIKLTQVSLSKSVASSFFFSLEFFDFQLETTPILAPKNQPLDFTTVYSVVVSNLFIHYLQTSGITIEMYRPQGASYELLAVGVVTLTSLLEEKSSRKYSAELTLKSLETGEKVAQLKYEIDVAKDLTERFSSFQRSEQAQKLLLPLEIPSTLSAAENFEQLTVNVNRCTGLQSLGRGNLETCIVYELLSFSPYFTDFVTSSSTAEFSSKRDWLIPKSDTSQLAHSTVSFYLVENAGQGDGVLSSLMLPMTPLARNGAIKGSFPMLLADGSDSGVKLDICVMWKFGAQVRTPTPSETVTTPQETPVLVSIPPAPVPQVIPPPMPRPTTVQTSSAVRLESPPMPTPSPSSSAESSDVFSPHKSMPMAWDVEVTPRSNARSSFIDDEIETISVRSHREEELPIEEELVPEAETPSPEIIPALPVELIPSSPSSSSSQVTVEHGGTIEAPEEEAVSPSSSTSSEQIKRSDEIRSLLGNLPPIAKPRTSTSKSMDSGGRNVLFTDPLHRSIPPSETSSVSSPRQNERQPVALPDSGGRSAIRHTSTSSQFEEEGNESGGALVTLWIEKFEVMDYSRLLLRYFDNTKVYVDWTFLDFPVEESKTNEFSLPRVAGEEAPIQFKKEYRLTRRRVALLKQWIELGNRVDFTLLIGGSEEEELGVAQLQLFTDPLEETTSISFLDVNGEHLAELHLALHYSPSIFDDV